MESSGEKAACWLEQLGQISDEEGALTRTFLSPATERAKAAVAGWMQEGGLQVFEDQAGNLLGRRDCGDPAAKTLVCGSHLDTVRNAGRFDGALGVIAGILAAARAAEKPLPYHLEVAAFSDEEGVRFQTTYLGSRFYIGKLGEAALAATDSAGISVRAAMASHRPQFPAPPARELLGYVEAHIEQGPVLEFANLALGVATGIAGQSRLRVRLEGAAGHAGTTPMTIRRDALAGAAECVTLLEEMANATNSLVATVGELAIASPASNVIPGTVTFTVDIRDADNAIRECFQRSFITEMEARMARRGLGPKTEIVQASPSVQCSARLTSSLEKIIKERQGSCPRFVSGAGHDVVALAEITETALLFVRCRNGLSHHPDEYASVEDISLAIDVLAELLGRFPSP